MTPDFSLLQLLLIGLLFVWTGFVRTGLGFGGAALGLPPLLFIHNGMPTSEISIRKTTASRLSDENALVCLSASPLACITR